MSFAPALLAITSLVGGAISAVGTMQAANASAAANEHNAKVAKVNARIANEQGIADAKRKGRDRVRIMGALANTAGANNLRMSGSVLDLAADSFLEAEEDIQLARYSGRVQATDYRNQATGFKMAAAQDRKAGGIGAVTQILGGVGSALKVYA